MLHDYNLTAKEISPTEFEVYEKNVKLLYFKYDYNNELTFFEYHDYATDDQIMAMFRYVAWYCYTHQFKVVRSINDLTHFDGSFAGIGEWFYSQYLPKAIEVGLRASAHVKPKDFFAQLALDELEEIAGDIYAHETFETLEQAHQWITQLEFEKVNA